MGSGPNPLAQVFGIGKGGAEPHDANGVAVTHLVADGAHPGDHHLQQTSTRNLSVDTRAKI